jgi:hypothetical protein
MTKLKKNKRLWFTSVFIVACAGIALALMMLITTTDNISKEVYVSQTKEFVNTYRDSEKLQELKLQEISIVASYNEEVTKFLEENDLENITKIEEEINARLNQKQQNTLNVKFYSTQNTTEKLRNSVVSAIQTKNNIFGIEVLFDGIFYVYLSPIIKDDTVIGVVQIKESIYFVKNSFERQNKEFVFLLDKKMLSFLSLQNRDGIYNEVGKNHLVDNKINNNKITSHLASLEANNFQKITQEEYMTDDVYFLNGTLIRDINGVEIGVLVLGESIENEDGFTNMAQKMADQIVLITLGLIVSLLLFLL